MQKLPIGIQTFSHIREENYIYIDKTKEAYELIENYRYAFLSRPRRFGKSLFLDTLRNIFEGNKKLFKGLYIYDKQDWSVKYPVIKISWDGSLQTLEDLNQKLFLALEHNQKKLGIECIKDDSAIVYFERLIKETYEKYNQRVVVLIDEYDRAILDVIENTNQAKINREFLKGLYSVFKGVDEYIKFVFLTGISKFSKASIFSGLNMLEDISLNKKFGNICGYTQQDIETSFLPYLDEVDLEKLKAWYNGYNFLKDSVYNPFDILQFIKNDKIFDNYWFSSGTPTFLIKLIEKNNYFLPKLSNLTIGKQLLDSFDIENIDLEVILYQSGYLTIDKVLSTPFDTIEYKLKLPNKEVKISFNDTIIAHIAKNAIPKAKTDIYMALINSELDKFKEIFVSIFASIPYNNFTNNNISNYEGFYASVIYVYLQSLGLEIIGEDVTNKGRIDLTIKLEDKIYIMEFKLMSDSNSNRNIALKQIKQKKYHRKYLNENKEIYLIGIEFDQKLKNISSFEWEKV